VALGVLLFHDGSRRLRRATAVGATVLVATLAVAYWQITPKDAAGCNAIQDELKRGACVMNFALRNTDATLCDAISFDASRWSCLYQIAERQRRPALCEQIALPCRFKSPGVQCQPATYRDVCYLVVARARGEGGWCDRIVDTTAQGNCRVQAGAGDVAR
jgi:hypothetical protein